MAKAYPREFRDDVVGVARKGQAPLSQIAKDFGISEGSLSNWMKKADIEDGNRGRILTGQVSTKLWANPSARYRGSCPIGYCQLTGDHSYTTDMLPGSNLLRILLRNVCVRTNC